MTTETLIEELSTSKLIEEGEVMASLQSVIATGIASHLFTYSRQTKSGFAIGDNTEYAIPGLGTKTKKPDTSFVTIAKMPKLNDKALIPFAPDLAVEVISANDDWKQIVAKANLYLEAGSSLVWVVDPYSRSVFVFRKGQNFQTLHVGEILTDEVLLPGFSLSISEIFDYPIEVEEPLLENAAGASQESE